MEIRCLSCGWTGKSAELIKEEIYKGNKTLLGVSVPNFDVRFKCPHCGNYDTDQFEDVRYPKALYEYHEADGEGWYERRT